MEKIGHHKEKTCYIFIGQILLDQWKDNRTLKGEIEIIKHRTTEGRKNFCIVENKEANGSVLKRETKELIEFYVSTNRIDAILSKGEKVLQKVGKEECDKDNTFFLVAEGAEILFTFSNDPKVAEKEHYSAITANLVCSN